METLISSPYSLFNLRNSAVGCPAICYGRSFRDSTNHALDEPIHAKQHLVGWFFTSGDVQLPGLIFDGAPEDVEAPRDQVLFALLNEVFKSVRDHRPKGRQTHNAGANAPPFIGALPGPSAHLLDRRHIIWSPVPVGGREVFLRSEFASVSIKAHAIGSTPLRRLHGCGRVALGGDDINSDVDEAVGCFALSCG